MLPKGANWDTRALGSAGEDRRNQASVAHPRRKKAPVLSIDSSAGMIWRGPEYPVLAPGIYTVRGVSVQGPQWVRSFRRWSIRLECSLVAEQGSVSAFFNLGDDPTGQRIGRQSRYYKAWVIANGEHPKKAQKMSPDVFLDGQFFEVEVATCNLDAEGKPKSDAEAYARIIRILSAHWP